MIRNGKPRFIPPRIRPDLGQIVSFDPKVEFRSDVQVQAPIQVQLGGLPLSLGLFLGSGLSFLVKPQLPQGLPQSLALFAGAGLAVGGILNLLLPKAHAAGPPAPPPGSIPTTAPVSAPGGPIAAPPGVQASERYAFDQITGRVSYPGETESVDIWPTASSYPITIQLYNASSLPATFYVELVADETPHPFGDPMRTSYPLQVTIGPGQTRDIPLKMPISSWKWNVDFVEVDLNVYKRRIPNEDAVRIASRFFVVD